MDFINYKPDETMSYLYVDEYDVNMGEDDLLKNLVELARYKEVNEEVDMLITENYESELAESMKATSIREFTGKYKRYGEKQIAKLIKGCEEEGLSIRASAIAAGVPEKYDK
ncbi:unnamed protein product [Cunninghamella echinulata]